MASSNDSDWRRAEAGGEGEDFERLIQAIRRIAQSGDRSDLPFLTQMTQKPDAEVRREAIAAAVILGLSEAADLARPLLQDRRAAVRSEAARALGLFGNLQDLKSLLPLVDSQDWSAREEALRAVEGLVERATDPNFKHALLLLAARHKVVQEAGERLLRRIPGTADIELLLVTFDSADIRSKIAILRYLAGRGRLDGVLVFEQAMREDSEEVRLAAVEAMGQMGSAMIGHLVEALGDAHWSVRARAQALLEQLPHVPADLLFDRLTHDLDKNVRASCAYLLGARKVASAIPRLVITLDDSFFIVRNAARRGLLLMGSQIRPALIEALSDELAGEHLRLIGIGLLASMEPGDDFWAILEENLTHRNQDVRAAVAEALAVFWPRSREHLLNLVEDPHWKVRMAAVDVLGRKAEEPLVDTLVMASKDQVVDVRVVAVRRLGRFRSEKSYEALTRSLKDPSWIVRYSSLMSMTNFGRRALPVARSLLASSRSSDRFAGLQMLEALSLPETIPEIREAAASWQEPTLEAAVSRVLANLSKLQG